MIKRFYCFALCVFLLEPAYAGFPVVYDPARGTPTPIDVSVPIKFNGTERCHGSRRPMKIALAGEITLSALPVKRLTGTDAANGLDFHEVPAGVPAEINLNNRSRNYRSIFYEADGATLGATKRRVTDYFLGIIPGSTDKLYGIVMYDYPLRTTVKTGSKFAIPGVIRPIIALRPDTYHHLIGEAWLTSPDGSCRIHGKFKQR